MTREEMLRALAEAQEREKKLAACSGLTPSRPPRRRSATAPSRSRVAPRWCRCCAAASSRLTRWSSCGTSFRVASRGRGWRGDDARGARGRPADPAGAAGSMRARGLAAAPLDGHDRRQPAPGDALLVLATEVPVLPARRLGVPRPAGRDREHAIFGNERCASAHPSDPAAALLALGPRCARTAASCRSPSSTSCRPRTTAR